MTLNEIYMIWIPRKSRRVKESTLNAYKITYERHFRKALGHLEITDINKRLAIPFFEEKLDFGLSPKSVADMIIVLKMIIRFAIEELAVDMPDPSWRVDFPTDSRSGAGQLQRYSPGEYKKIVRYLQENPSFKNLAVLIVLCSGMRIGEICALQWGDVDIDNRVFHIRKTIQRLYVIDHTNPTKRYTKVIQGAPKTASSSRDIPILKEIYPLVKKYKAIFRDDYYVCSGTTKFVEPRVLRNHFNLMVDSAGVRRLRFHGLRHTFATTLIENNVDYKTTAVLLGHSNIKTTLDIYVHPSDDAKKDAVNRGLKNMFK